MRDWPDALNMLDTMNIKSTFFVPGAVIETYRDTVEETTGAAMSWPATATGMNPILSFPGTK